MRIPRFPRSIIGLPEPDWFDFDNEIAIKQQMFRKRHDDLKAMSAKFLTSGSESSLNDIREALIAKGIDKECLVHSGNDMSEWLSARINGYDIHIEKPVFPKRKNTFITIELKMESPLRWNVDSASSSGSIADFLIEFSLWVPSYIAYENGIVTKIKQEKMARELAFDLLERNVEPVVNEKGYTYYLTQCKDIATLTIEVSDDVRLDFKVELKGDFLKTVMKIVSSLPVGQGNDMDRR